MTRLGIIRTQLFERFFCPPENSSYREYTVNPVDLQYKLFPVSFFSPVQSV